MRCGKHPPPAGADRRRGPPVATLRVPSPRPCPARREARLALLPLQGLHLREHAASPDLLVALVEGRECPLEGRTVAVDQLRTAGLELAAQAPLALASQPIAEGEIGRASCRER